MQEDGKQFADAPESSAARMVPVALMGPKVTLLVVLLADRTRIAFPVFRIDVGDLVDMLDTEEPAVVMVSC